MEFGFIVLVVIIIVAVAIPLAIAQSRRADDAWSKAARTLRLHFRSGSLFQTRRISGRYHDLPVVVDTHQRGSGKSRRTYTRFRVGYGRSLGLGLRLTREGFFSGVAKTFGAQDIEVGDEAFDRDLLIKGRDPRRVREFLTPSRRLRIHRLFSKHRDARIGDREIVWETWGLVRDAARIVGAVQALARVAWHLSGERDEDRSLDEAIALQGDGRPEGALAVLRAGIAQRMAARARRAPPPLPDAEPAGEGSMPPRPPSPAEPPALLREEREPPEPPEPPAVLPEVPLPLADTERSEGADDEPEVDPVEEHLLEGEILYLADRRAEARQAFERALEAAPDDEEVQGWVAETSDEETSGEEERQSSAPEPPLDPASICESLFSAENTSLDASRIFSERYEDRTVSWRGRLAHLEGYSYDFVFGNGPGMKAVVEVHELASVPYGDPTVKAVVQLAEESAGELAGREGEDIGFEGRLLRADGFLRNVYVADGRIA